MDIKLTHTGVIPLDDFPEGQNFLVWFDIHCSGAVLLYKAGEVLHCSGNLHSVPKTQKFLAWEPVQIEHDFSPYETKSLWLMSPDLFKPTGWVFRDCSNPEQEYVCEIRDNEFIENQFKKRSSLSFSAGDIYAATINKIPNDEGLYEIIRLVQTGSNPERFAKTFLGRA